MSVRWSSGREAESRISSEDTGTDEAQAVNSNQQRPPGSAGASSNDCPHTESSGKSQRPADYEQGDVDPSPFSVAQQAEWMTPDVVTWTRQHFNHAQRHVQRTGDNAAGKESSCQVEALC